MRIRTITGLALAGVAAAAAAAVGSAAYAGSDGETASVVRTVTEDGSRGTVIQNQEPGGSTAPRDCPDKGGSGQGESGAPTTPEQPPASAETL